MLKYLICHPTPSISNKRRRVEQEDGYLSECNFNGQEGFIVFREEEEIVAIRCTDQVQVVRFDRGVKYRGYRYWLQIQGKGWLSFNNQAQTLALLWTLKSTPTNINDQQQIKGLTQNKSMVQQKQTPEDKPTITPIKAQNNQLVQQPVDRKVERRLQYSVSIQQQLDKEVQEKVQIEKQEVSSPVKLSGCLQYIGQDYNLTRNHLQQEERQPSQEQAQPLQQTQNRLIQTYPVQTSSQSTKNKQTSPHIPLIPEPVYQPQIQQSINNVVQLTNKQHQQPLLKLCDKTSILDMLQLTPTTAVTLTSKHALNYHSLTSNHSTLLPLPHQLHASLYTSLQQQLQLIPSLSPSALFYLLTPHSLHTYTNHHPYPLTLPSSFPTLTHACPLSQSTIALLSDHTISLIDTRQPQIVILQQRKYNSSSFRLEKICQYQHMLVVGRQDGIIRILDQRILGKKSVNNFDLRMDSCPKGMFYNKHMPSFQYMLIQPNSSIFSSYAGQAYLIQPQAIHNHNSIYTHNIHHQHRCPIHKYPQNIHNSKVTSTDQKQIVRFDINNKGDKIVSVNQKQHCLYNIAKSTTRMYRQKIAPLYVMFDRFGNDRMLVAYQEADITVRYQTEQEIY